MQGCIRKEKDAKDKNEAQRGMASGQGICVLACGACGGAAKFPHHTRVTRWWYEAWFGVVGGHTPEDFAKDAFGEWLSWKKGEILMLSRGK